MGHLPLSGFRSNSMMQGIFGDPEARVIQIGWRWEFVWGRARLSARVPTSDYVYRAQSRLLVIDLYHWFVFFL